MAGNRSWTKSLFIGLWNVLNFSRKLFFNIIFIIIAVVIISALNKDSDKIGVTPNSILDMKLIGRLVIETEEIDPFEQALQEAFEQEDDNPEVLVRDVVYALENAAQDNRIKGVMLNVQGLAPSGLDKLRIIAQAVEAFRESGKPIYAVGDYFSRDQYYVAAHASEIFLNPMGSVMVDGYASFGLYLKNFLDKLKINTHIFRVGTYKSAVEPFMRNDMSQEAKDANLAWISSYWEQYKKDVARARGFDVSNFDEKFEDYLTRFEAVDGDFSTYAVEYGWVDALKSREQIREAMTELVDDANNRNGFATTSMKTYMSVINPQLPKAKSSKDTVAIIVASGTILDGDQKAGAIGGDSTARLIRRARLDDNVKAVVLRVDSPGGSAFASEVIRQEILNLKEAGKPIVTQMGSYAASGGYWISASTDYIVASPSTITGSIGVFGLFMTYEDSLGYLGISSDGVSTTEMANFSTARPLNDGYKDLLQRSVESTYGKFIGLVARERQLDLARVDEIAQGRVWIGEAALDLGLVDELGGLDTAVVKAAELAELEDYDTRYVKRQLSSKDMFWKEFFGQAMAAVTHSMVSGIDSPLFGLVKQAVREFDAFASLNDPNGVYIYCIQCNVR